MQSFLPPFMQMTLKHRSSPPPPLRVRYFNHLAFLLMTAVSCKDGGPLGEMPMVEPLRGELSEVESRAGREPQQYKKESGKGRGALWNP